MESDRFCGATHQELRRTLALVCMVWKRAARTICRGMELSSVAAWTSFMWRQMTTWEKSGKFASGMITQVHYVVSIIGPDLFSYFQFCSLRCTKSNTRPSSLPSMICKIANKSNAESRNYISFVLCFVLLCVTHGHFGYVITFSFNTPLLAFGNSGEHLLNSLEPLFSCF